MHQSDRVESWEMMLSAPQRLPPGRHQMALVLSSSNCQQLGCFWLQLCRGETVLGEDVWSENLRKAFLSKFRQVSSLTYEKNKSETQAKKQKNTVSESSRNGSSASIFPIVNITTKPHRHNQFHNISCLKMALLSNKAQNTHC